MKDSNRPDFIFAAAGLVHKTSSNDSGKHNLSSLLDFLLNTGIPDINRRDTVRPAGIYIPLNISTTERARLLIDLLRTSLLLIDLP